MFWRVSCKKPAAAAARILRNLHSYSNMMSFRFCLRDNMKITFRPQTRKYSSLFLWLKHSVDAEWGDDPMMHWRQAQELWRWYNALFPRKCSVYMPNLCLFLWLWLNDPLLTMCFGIANDTSCFGNLHEVYI